MTAQSARAMMETRRFMGSSDGRKGCTDVDGFKRETRGDWVSIR
jgi:hypothetical protein